MALMFSFETDNKELREKVSESDRYYEVKWKAEKVDREWADLGL